MFGHRCDGKIAKDIDPFMRIIPYIMKKRSDAQVFYRQDLDYDFLRSYVKEKRSEGLNISMMHLIIATVVRVCHERPALKRFISGGRVYNRNEIMISFAVKRKLTDDADETTIKIPFNGEETLEEVCEKINVEIAANKGSGSENGTDKLAKVIMAMPAFLVKFTVNLIIFLDNHGLLPKAIIDVSPFHTGVFITNLKSIGLGYVYHHIYDFGTTGMFISIGKQTEEVVVNKNGDFETKKMLHCGVVVDERICDGLYFANTMKAFKRILSEPSVLESRPQK